MRQILDFEEPKYDELHASHVNFKTFSILLSCQSHIKATEKEHFNFYKLGWGKCLAKKN